MTLSPRLASLLVASVLLGLGCPTIGDDTPLAGETETETGVGDQAPEGCECILDSEPPDDWSAPPMPTCGEPLCPIVEASGDATSDPSFALANPEALDCALGALRDRTPGLLQWRWNDGLGMYDDSGYILIHPEGTAVHRRWGAHDLAFEVSDARIGALPEASHYDACIALENARARFDCMRDTAIAEAAICNEGWLSESI